MEVRIPCGWVLGPLLHPSTTCPPLRTNSCSLLPEPWIHSPKVAFGIKRHQAEDKAGAGKEMCAFCPAVSPAQPPRARGRVEPTLSEQAG